MTLGKAWGIENRMQPPTSAEKEALSSHSPWTAKWSLPVVGQALVELSILLVSDVIRVSGPDRALSCSALLDRYFP